jgi:hypothetical protein
MTLRYSLALIALVAAPALAAPADDLAPFVGRWQLDPAQTHMGRNGPTGQNILRSTSFTFRFSPAADGLRMDVFSEWPLAAPTRWMEVIADGKDHVCPGPAPCLTNGGAPSEQTYRFVRLDDHTLARMLYVRGAMYDYSTMSVATDGRTLTLISWDPHTPQYQNIQVFGKQP